MIAAGADLKAALAGTELAGRAVFELPIGDGEERAFAVAIAADEVESAWASGRSVLEATGRWPVAVTAFEDVTEDIASDLEKGDLFSRFFFEEGAADGDDVSPAAILSRRDPAALDPFIDALIDEDPDILSDEDAEVVDDFGEIDWFVPDSQPNALVFLPTADSASALAYLHWYGAVGHPSERFVDLLARWQERYGAELVAHFGTMLGFHVSSPPADSAVATALAREHVAVAPCTILLPGDAFSSYASSLVSARRWFLHERP